MPKQTAATEKQQAGTRSSNTSPTISLSSVPHIMPRKADGDGSLTVSGELEMWHKITLTVDGPYAHEQGNVPNPFTDIYFGASFTHADGTQYNVSAILLPMVMRRIHQPNQAAQHMVSVRTLATRALTEETKQEK